MGFEVSAVRITKKFKNSVALDGASISAKNGISVIIGPNGAGKSTATTTTQVSFPSRPHRTTTNRAPILPISR